MHNLPGNPFVLVLNLQIPGDPPVSIVFYFLVPTTFYPGKNPSDGLDATREMFRKLIDCPITPPVEENQAYLDEVNELINANQNSDDVRLIFLLFILNLMLYLLLCMDYVLNSLPCFIMLEFHVNPSSTLIFISSDWLQDSIDAGSSKNKPKAPEMKNKSSFFVPPAPKSWTR